MTFRKELTLIGCLSAQDTSSLTSRPCRRFHTVPALPEWVLPGGWYHSLTGFTTKMMRTDSKNRAMLVTTSFSWCKNGVSPIFPHQRSSVKNRSKNRSETAGLLNAGIHNSFENSKLDALRKGIALKLNSIPSRKLTYPTLGKGKSSSKCHFGGIC